MYSADDESLHSFIYRLIFLKTGEHTFKGLVSKSGSWEYAPFVHKNAVQVFRSEGDAYLFDKMFRTGALNFRYRLIDAEYYYYYDQLNKVFDRGRGRHYAKKPIDVRYCQTCIEQMIHHSGYAYFRTDWLYMVYCKEHREYLKKLCSTSSEEDSKAIRDILQGKFDSNFISLSGENQNPEVGYEPSEYYPIKLPKCSVIKLINYVVRNVDNLEDIDVSKAYESISGPFFNSFFDTPEKIISVFEHRTYYFFKTFIHSKKVNDFLRGEYQQRLVQLGTRRELSEVVLVPHDADCSVCPKKVCRKYMIYSQINLHTPKELYDKSSYLQKIMSLETYLSKVGKELWSPISWDAIPMYRIKY